MKLVTFKYIFALLLLINGSDRAFCQLAIDKYPISDFKFDSVFGVNKNDESSIYCLLGKGFFQAPRSENSDFLIQDWIEKHPNAVVVPVTEVKTDKNHKFIYSWVIQDSDTLNLHLVRLGAVSGGTMIKPRSSQYETEIEQKISGKEYDDFLKQVKLAEESAFEKKLGIWANFKEK